MSNVVQIPARKNTINRRAAAIGDIFGEIEVQISVDKGNSVARFRGYSIPRLQRAKNLAYRCGLPLEIRFWTYPDSSCRREWAIDNNGHVQPVAA